MHIERNTTLPHPDADLSANACITQDDVYADLALRRTGGGSLSFLHRSKKYSKKGVSHGIVAPNLAAATPSLTSLAPSTTASTTNYVVQKQESISQRTHNMSQPSIIETPPSPTISKYARDSFATSRREDDDETPPTSPDDASMKSSRKLFGRFRRHH